MIGPIQNPALAGALIMITGLTVSGAQAAGSSCQRTIDANDYAAVCCKVTAGGRTKYFRTNRKRCLAGRGTAVNRDLCPRRGRSTDPNGWVCCEHTSLSVALVGKRRVTGWMAAAKCKTLSEPRVVARSRCIQKRTRRDRMLECRKRGKDWTWKNGRCVRASVRDRRHP